MNWKKINVVEDSDERPVFWVCNECGNKDTFERSHGPLCGSFCDCDVECLECGSVDTEEDDSQ